MTGSLFNKVADLRPAILLKKRFWRRCFPVNFAKFLRTPFLQKISGWFILNCTSCQGLMAVCNMVVRSQVRALKGFASCLLFGFHSLDILDFRFML